MNKALLNRWGTGLAWGVVLLVVLNIGQVALYCVIAAFMLISMYEILNALALAGFTVFKWVHYACAVLMIGVIPFGEPRWDIAALLLCVAVALISVVFTKGKPDASNMLSAILPTMYPFIPFVALLLLASYRSEHAMLMLWLLCFSSIFSDVFAFLIGSKWGKHKLIPHVSPNKSVEGALGGLIGAIALTLVVGCYGYLFNHTTLPFAHIVAIGVVGSVATQVGDLVASYIKRFCGVKDFGSFFPGHGGVLDRVDGLLINAVAVYAYCLIFL